MNWTAMRITDASFFAGYAIWFALLAWRRLCAPGMKLLPFTDRLRGLGLGVLLLPVFTAEPALWGTLGKLFTVAAPGIALAFWTFAPRHVSSKVVPLAIVADGLYGFYRVRLDLRYFLYYGPHSSKLSYYPQFLLLEAWVFIGVGLWLTWRATDQNSSVARMILRENGRRPGEPGRPRWGLLLLPVAGLIAELFGRNFWLGASWWGGVQTFAIAAAMVFFVVKAPRTAANLALAGLISFGLYGIALGVYWPGHIPLLSPHEGLGGYGVIYLDSVGNSAIAAGLEGLALTGLGLGLWLAPHVLAIRARSAGAPEQLSGLESDLHDAVQARLIALGMILGTAERLVATSPQAALELVAEARNVEVLCASSSPKISSCSETV